MLKLGRSRLDIELETLMMIDSLDMTEEDRKLILESCKNTEEDKIVITHGTDTMVETAKVLANGIKDKVIVLTGAMIPMNGKCFFWDNVRKNKEIGEFEEISDLG